MTANNEMKELNTEAMELISGGFPHFNPLYPGFPPRPLPETRNDEPKDGGATGGW